jgi:anti-sigma factor RsiW
MSTQRKSPDDVRALFSDHLEGALDDATKKVVDDALAADPALAAEHRRFAATLRGLRALPRPDVPVDFAARVRARIAAEADAPAAISSASSPSSSVPGSSGSSGSSVSSVSAVPLPLAAGSSAVALSSTALAPANDVLPLHRALNDEIELARPRKRFGVEFFAAVGSIAAVLVLVAVGIPVFNGRAYLRGDSGGVVTAGLASAGTVDVVWKAQGLPRAVIFSAAAEAGVTLDAQDRFVGDRDAVARFLVALKTAGAARDVDVKGSVPEEADRVVVFFEQ